MSKLENNDTKPAENKSILDDYAKVILETSIDGFCIISPDAKFVEVNSAYCEMLGYSRDEFIGMKISDIEARETEKQTKKL